MTNDIRIEPLRPEDREVWGALWRDYLAFYGAERPKQVFDHTFERYSSPERDDMRAWLAWRGNDAIGLVHAIAHPHGWQMEDVTYLQDLYTAPSARGAGVGRALIETVVEDAKAEGRGSVYWLTQTHNQAARALYDKVAEPTDFMKYNKPEVV